MYGYNILVGAGAGCYIVAGFGIVQSLVPAKDIANAVGSMTICKRRTYRRILYVHISQSPILTPCVPPAQDLGMVCFLAICGSMFHNIAVEKVGSALPGASVAEIGNLIAGTSSSAFQALSDADKAVVVPQLSNAMTSIWVFFLAAGALSFLLSLPLAVCIP